jgi:chemotaxis protein histidine kinase CheA
MTTAMIEPDEEEVLLQAPDAASTTTTATDVAIATAVAANASAADVAQIEQAFTQAAADALTEASKHDPAFAAFHTEPPAQRYAMNGAIRSTHSTPSRSQQRNGRTTPSRSLPAVATLPPVEEASEKPLARKSSYNVQMLHPKHLANLQRETVSCKTFVMSILALLVLGLAIYLRIVSERSALQSRVETLTVELERTTSNLTRDQNELVNCLNSMRAIVGSSAQYSKYFRPDLTLPLPQPES